MNSILHNFDLKKNKGTHNSLNIICSHTSNTSPATSSMTMYVYAISRFRWFDLSFVYVENQVSHRFPPGGKAIRRKSIVV